MSSTRCATRAANHALVAAAQCNDDEAEAVEEAVEDEEAAAEGVNDKDNEEEGDDEDVEASGGVAKVDSAVALSARS